MLASLIHIYLGNTLALTILEDYLQNKFIVKTDTQIQILKNHYLFLNAIARQCLLSNSSLKINWFTFPYNHQKYLQYKGVAMFLIGQCPKYQNNCWALWTE